MMTERHHNASKTGEPTDAPDWNGLASDLVDGIASVLRTASVLPAAGLDVEAIVDRSVQERQAGARRVKLPVMDTDADPAGEG